MRKIMILVVLAFVGLTTTGQEKPEATSANAKALIPVTAEIGYSLNPYGASGNFWITTSRPVGTRVKYTVTFRGHTKGDWTFYLDSGRSSSLQEVILFAAMGRAEITAVSPASDGVYDYTAALGAEIEW